MTLYNKHISILITILIFISLKINAQEVNVIDKKGTIQTVKNTRVFTGAANKPANANAVIGDIYFDQYPNPNSVEIWDGTSWKVIKNNTTHTGTTGSVFFADLFGNPSENNNQFFWDNTNERLYLGNPLLGTNKLNVNGTTRTSALNNGNGTVGLPSYRFHDDSDTGMYRITDNQLGFSTNGTNALSIDASQNISIPQNLSVTGTYADTSGDVGTNGQILSSTATGTDWIDNAALNNWLITGNTGTTAANFLGTIDSQDLVLKTNNIERLRVTNNRGQVRINQAPIFNNHPLVVRANGVDVLAFQDEFGTPKWHWNLLADGLNFVESNIADYRLFLENGGSVGINTDAPTERLDVNGKLRVRDIATVTTNNEILTPTATGVIEKKVLISTDANNQITPGTDGGVYIGPTVHTGTFIIDGEAPITITGIPFEPSQVTFVANANIESLNVDDNNGTDNVSAGPNDNGINNCFGTINGFARSLGSSIIQQTMYSGGHGNSINNISRYSSDDNCIGIRYGDQNGRSLGKIEVAFGTFNADGFTLTINYTNGVVTNNSANPLNNVQPGDINNEKLLVLYTAYK
ncbi:hypothetical protein [Tenacibaculum soleae]|uniref:hypothetical protein n=1 Tax=Tenacibaculum soleae TaxID=447689 RepID=UPI0023012736|nr:hypothetical protein [Tenacibaculum soleae]